jgi:hypothetical protein
MTKTTLSRVLQGGCAAAVIALSPMASADVTLSGQVNRAIIHADDGVDTGTHFVDNDVSSTRFRIKGDHQLDDALTFGMEIEGELRSNSSVNYTINQDSSKGSYKGVEERKLEIYIDSKNAGRLWLGQGDMASNSSAEQDVSGTSVINHAEFDKLGRSLQFRATQADADGKYAEVAKVGNVFNDMDGLSRQDRLRYDTPSFGGVKLSTSVTEGDAWDVGATYSGKMGGSKIAAALAYANSGDNPDFKSKFDNQLSGSLSFMHSSGFNVTLAGGKQDSNADDNDGLLGEGGFFSDDDPTFYYAKLGYQLKSSIGSTSFSLDYGNVQDLDAVDDEAEGYGAFLVQKIDKVSTELYLGYRQFSLTRPGADVEDIGIIVGGARVKF